MRTLILYIKQKREKDFLINMWLFRYLYRKIEEVTKLQRHKMGVQTKNIYFPLRLYKFTTKTS